jgi:hypothetical protein
MKMLPFDFRKLGNFTHSLQVNGIYANAFFYLFIFFFLLIFGTMQKSSNKNASTIRYVMMKANTFITETK